MGSIGFKERVEGVVLGTAFGDALGAVVEKLSYEEIKKRYKRVESLNIGWWKEPLPPEDRLYRMRGYGIFTDDTLMTLALMDVYNNLQRHIDAYDMAHGFIKEIAFKKRFIPELNKETYIMDRLFYPEKYIFIRHTLANCNPREGGIGNMVNCGAAMYIAPIGVVNACNPKGAYDEAILFAMGHQSSYGLEAAGVLAACVAKAFVPDVTMDEILETAISLAKDGTKDAIEDIYKAAKALKDKKEDKDFIIGEFHKIMKKYSPMEDDISRKIEKVGIPSNHYTPSRLFSIEELPIALGYCVLHDGDFYGAVMDGINSGRDTDSIGVMIGSILGAVHGSSIIKKEDIELLERANKSDLIKNATVFSETASKIINEDIKNKDKICGYLDHIIKKYESLDNTVIPNNYLEKLYAGLLGKIIGVRIGAPVEPAIWTYDKIKSIYGDITFYVKDYKNFAADDDINGPIFFIRALMDYAKDRNLQPHDVGRAWLNYTRENSGMFWWGGYGRSSEHTAYLNLKNGIEAPKSGCWEQNGIVLAEQIGGQIFIDSWGLVWPNNIEKAAEYAEKAASVSHDKNGIYGGRFIAACISKAFETENVIKIIDAGLSVIPKDCEYARVTTAVLDFYNKNPDDFRKCRDHLTEKWGYDRYPGVCHIIPNAGVCILSLLYGKGDLSRTVEIATMCGWDTDCNAGNVGTIIGVAQGLKGIKEKYRKPINDMVVTSSISGYLNIIDIPTIAKEMAILGYKLSKEEIPGYLRKNIKPGQIYFDFNLPGSTHGFRSSNEHQFAISHTDEITYDGRGAIQVLLDRVQRGNTAKIYYKPYYRREDFDDERYNPAFSPLVYPGQKVSLKVYLDKWNGVEIGLAAYVRNTVTKEDIKLCYEMLRNNKWYDIDFTVPDMNGHAIDEVGIIVESFTKEENKTLSRMIIDEFRVDGKAKYMIDFNNETIEFGCVTPFTHNRGSWSIENGRMHCMSIDTAEAYTGNYYTKDIHIKAELNPQFGTSHNLAFRVKGAMMGYHVGFDGENKVSLIKNDHKLIHLITVDYPWQMNQNYVFEIYAKDNCFIFKIDDKIIMEYTDDEMYFEYGMFGFSKFGSGRTSYGRIFVEEM